MMHLSPYEVLGSPHVLGRAKLLALLVLVKYVTDLLDGKVNMHLDLYSDSLEAVNFARDIPEILPIHCLRFLVHRPIMSKSCFSLLGFGSASGKSMEI